VTPIARPKRLLLGGYLQDPSGAGLIHAELGAGLRSAPHAAGVSTEVMPLYSVVPPVWRRLGAKLPPCDVLVWTSTPLPVRVPSDVPLFPVIYDLRWVKTRSGPSRLYRALDLARTLRRACGVFTISNVVAGQLSLLTNKRIHVLPMGPGQFEGHPIAPPTNTRTIVLIGHARHKRNEEAARLITGTRAVAENYRVVAVDVSRECAEILQAGMSPESLSIRPRVARAVLAEILTESSVFLSLGVDEGFGFPYIESRYFGCDVIAPNIPITREVLGPDCPGLLASIDGDALITALDSWDFHRIERDQQLTQERSWVHASRALLDEVERYV
jgi:glycosyltransferase involved in cell wall biosynthesis